MKQIILTLDKKHSMMSAKQAFEIESEFKDCKVFMNFNIDTQVWELALVK